MSNYSKVSFDQVYQRLFLDVWHVLNAKSILRMLNAFELEFQMWLNYWLWLGCLLWFATGIIGIWGTFGFQGRLYLFLYKSPR